LSVVVPARNEAACLPQLLLEIAQALRPLCTGQVGTLTDYEIIVVDDGSTDATRSVLRQLMAAYPELRAVALVTCGGQSAATLTGIRAARGNWIATLDADLQNDPADLVRLWNALPGHDVALGWRVKRHGPVGRRVISRWANRVRNLVLGQAIHDTGCSVRIFPRALALRLPAFRGMHRFFGPLLLREGCRLVQVPVSDRRRAHGQSHYSLLNRSIHVVIDLFGVAWLLRRRVECAVIEHERSRNEVGRTEARALVPIRVPLEKGA
jgi:glycosyltransferase involved in cell wall biosynthesis